MIRRDIGLDPDRPHYYSQYWVDVASGKPAATATSAAGAHEVADADDGDNVVALMEADLAEPEMAHEPPTPVRPAAKKVEPKKAEPKQAITSLADLARIDRLMKSSAEMDSDSIPDIESAVSAPDDLDIVTDFEPTDAGAEVEEPSDESAAEFAGEYDDEDDWGEDDEQPRRGSKPNKRRENRRGETRRDF